MEKEKGIGKKTILAWVREILSRNETLMEEIPSPPTEEVVERLLNKAAGEKIPADGAEGSASSDSESREGDSADNEDNDSKEGGNGDKHSCAYEMKRNIVASLQEIRRFAEEHNLAATMVRALLTLLAEMAIGALKGKVGEKALDILLKAFNYQQAVNDAYLRGKNDTITKEYFPEADSIPHLGGMSREEPDTPDIFTMAKQA